MVSESDPVRITVEISRAEPFRGTILEPDQPTQSFNGWTAFAASIAGVVRRIGTAAPDSSADTGDGG
jgi:hypothetical protein